MRKRNPMFLVLILFLSSNLNFTSERERELEIDGYVWIEFSFEMKVGYIKGYAEAVLLVSKEYDIKLKEYSLIKENELMKTHKSILEKFHIWGATYGQVIEGIDEIYKDYSNKKISVYLLIPLICKKVRGEINSEETEKELQELRAKLSKEK